MHRQRLVPAQGWKVAGISPAPTGPGEHCKQLLAMNVQERNVYFTVNMARASAKKASKPDMVQALGLGGLRPPSPPGTAALRAKEHLAIAPPHADIGHGTTLYFTYG